MRFRVSAVQDEGLPQSLNDARLWLEEWLNKSLNGAEFGCPSATIMIVVFASSSLITTPAVSRLSTDPDGNPTLALHIVIEPASVLNATPEDHLRLLCAHIEQGFPSKPVRKPKGLDYMHLRDALLACIRPLAHSAA